MRRGEINNSFTPNHIKSHYVEKLFYMKMSVNNESSGSMKPLNHEVDCMCTDWALKRYRPSPAAAPRLRQNVRLRSLCRS